MRIRMGGKGAALWIGATAALALVGLQGTVRADSVVDQAKADVAKATGLQTEWTGPTSAPPVAAGKKIVYLSGDEQIDTSHEYGVYMQQAAAKIASR